MIAGEGNHWLSGKGFHETETPSGALKPETEKARRRGQNSRGRELQENKQQVKRPEGEEHGHV